MPPPECNEYLSLSWTPPATRVDGSSLYLYELGGYEVHYGTTDGRFRMSVSVPGQDSYGATIKNLQSGIAYYFMVRVYDAEGRYSGFSPQRIITIP
ncbi:MAG: fibronectin type III domain-containing protein [Ectothiorhodospiraceae bacterium]|nr:fibronectin type III domain-containing protein [Ectothiorhodospiraceae bacterium]